MRPTLIPNPGFVATSGDAVALPQATKPGRIPGDPIGLDLDPAGRPAVLLGGVGNLQEALLRRLRCPRGYLPHHPDYGSRLPRYLGRPLTVSTVLSIRDEAARTLRADPRVLAIRRLSVNVDADYIQVDAVVETPLGEVEIGGPIGRVEG